MSFPEEMNSEESNETAAETGGLNQGHGLAYTHPPVTMFTSPARPPLSGAEHPKHRVSKSISYDKKCDEWYIKMTPTLPKLWIRDSGEVSPEVCHEWDRSWRRYATLGIPGNGDGAGLAARTRHGRRKLKDDYKKLDPKVRAAKEVALARYSPFCLRKDGTLDYFTGRKKGSLVP